MTDTFEFKSRAGRRYSVKISPLSGERRAMFLKPQWRTCF
jgi:hypothetical protein